MNIKKLMNVAVFMLTLTSLSAFATGPLDDGVETCGVPVCDIEATANALSELNEDQRYNFSNKLLTKYSQSQNLEILENLLDASKRFKNLSISTNDADWVVRESNSLFNAMVIGLSKYSKVEANLLSGYYKLISTELKRYEIIEFWMKSIKTIEDSAKLNEIVKFAKNAKLHSISLGDEAWIPRAAGALADSVTVKLVSLDPVHEGLYDVSSTISGETYGILPFDKISVLDSSADKNLVVVLYNTKYRRASFVFNNVVISGDTLSSTAVSNAITSKKLNIKIDRETGVVTGSVTTTDSTVDFTGKQTFSTRSVFNGNTVNGLTENDVIGTFNGKLGNLDVKLTIKSFLPGVYSATLRSTDGILKKDYKGKFFAKSGVISLTHKSELRLVLGLKQVDGNLSWEGFSFSVKKPAVVEVSLRK
mgnify:CR=1 FL=1